MAILTLLGQISSTTPCFLKERTGCADTSDFSSDIRIASHVEPQLLAYLIFHHALVRFSDEDEDEDFDRIGPLQNILNGLLPLTPVPIITVNKPDFCRSCLDNFNIFRRTFDFMTVRFCFVGENATGPVLVRQ